MGVGVAGEELLHVNEGPAPAQDLDDGDHQVRRDLLLAIGHLAKRHRFGQRQGERELAVGYRLRLVLPAGLRVVRGPFGRSLRVARRRGCRRCWRW